MSPEILARILKSTHYPHRLCKDARGVLWEFISYPWADESGTVLVNIRVPGDPTTIREELAIALDPENQDCLCAVAGEFYFNDPPRWAKLR